MSEILQGEFFWGIVVGLILAFIGGWIQAWFAVSMQQASVKKTIKNYCVDAIKTIQGIISEMQSTRDRTKSIYYDFLALLDVEIQIYGRNREHLIHLPEEERKLVRKFMNDVVALRAETAQGLDRFYELTRLADQAQTEGRGSDAQELRATASVPLIAAQTAADRLASISSTGNQIIAKLESIR